MATTKNQYTGDGSTTLFPFTFPYIAESDIVVTIDDVVQTIITEYVFSNATTIGFLTAPADGVSVQIGRVTSSDDLKATFFPGSAIRARDLNDNFTQNLYVTQEALVEAGNATGNSQAAQAAAEAAQVSASTAQSSAAIAQSSATDAQNQVAIAQAQATAAQTAAADSAASSAQAAADSAQAVADSASATATANSAAADAATAISTSNASSALAALADGKADQSLTESALATSTAQSADAKADTAIATANASTATASGAESTANQAAADATTAVTNAQTALDAVGNVLDYTIVSNVADIPGTPSDAEAVQVADSTGIESLTPLTGLPSGFVGDSGIFVRIVYRVIRSSWEFISYAANDADVRYVRRGDNVSELINDSNYVATGDNVSELVNDSNYVATGDNVSELINDSNFIDASGAPVQSVNGLTGDVTITLTNSLNDLTDVDTASTGHVPADGQSLIWNEGHSHWMPGDAAANIVDQGDFAYASTSNTLVWPSGSNNTGNSIIDPNDWTFTGNSFIWATAYSLNAELQKLEVGDSVTFEVAGFSYTGLVELPATINAYEGPSGVNSGPTSYYITLNILLPPNSSEAVRVTSIRFSNGLEPLLDGDILKYVEATGKWTPAPSLVISDLPVLP